jgi:hypothetical protein
VRMMKFLFVFGRLREEPLPSDGPTA